MPFATQPFLLLNIPPSIPSTITCNMHFITPIIFARCTAQSRAMLAGMFLGGLGLIISEHLERFSVTSLTLIQKEKRPTPKIHVRFFNDQVSRVYEKCLLSCGYSWWEGN